MPEESKTQARGLSADEAARRLAVEGANELPSSERRGVWTIAWEVVREPMFLLLVGCGLVYLFLGEPREASVLLGFVVVVMGITFYEERKTEHALEALRDLSSPRALVIRDGERLRIPGREVVRGDLVVLSEGDRVPADALLRDTNHLVVDESLLTGESVPVRKTRAAAEAPMQRPGGDDSPSVFSGTLVVSGQGVAEVQATGDRTEIGKLGHALKTIDTGDSPLQQQTHKLVRVIAVGAILLCLAVAFIYGYSRGHWLDALLAGITLAMALLPEEFPVILTVFLALGAWRIARRNVLTRRIPAVEALGSATVLCVDKTGTLTENRMCVRTLVDTDGERFRVGETTLPERAHKLVEFALLATRRDPFDPMERAIRQLGLGGLIDPVHLHGDWDLVREYPLRPELLSMAQVWEDRRNGTRAVAAKGAPEAIAELCHLDPARREALMAEVVALSGQGLRVLGVATAEVTHEQVDLTRPDRHLPPRQHDIAFEFLGLIGLIDPVRPSVPEAVAACQRAGIRVLMITGDYPGTATSIGREIGLSDPDNVLNGIELDALDDAALAERLKTCNIVARAVPEQKLRIVRALQANAEVVAMTGDGVNDAPALRAADIGVAMGGRGTDVAREAAALVVVDDDFGSIVHAVRLGRRIFDNLRRALGYTIAVHLPIAGMSLIPVLFGWPLVLLPAHIAFLELIINPTCSIVFEAEQEDPRGMARPPRDRAEPLIGRRILGLALLQGTLVLAAVLGIYLIAEAWGYTEEAVRTLSFVTLVLGNLSLILCNRSQGRRLLDTLGRRNRALWTIVSGGVVLLVAVVTVPALRDLFFFAVPPMAGLGLAVVMGVCLVPVIDLINRGYAAVTK